MSASAQAPEADGVLQAPDLIERLRVLPADAGSIYRPRRHRPGLAQDLELDEQAGELLLELAGMGADDSGNRARR